MTEPLHPLYAHFAYQGKPQDAFVEMDSQTGELIADHNQEEGNPMPGSVFLGHCFRWRIVNDLTQPEIDALLARLRPLVPGFLTGSTVAAVEFKGICDEARTASGGIMEAKEWFAGVELGDYYDRIPQSIIADLAEEQEADAREEGITLVGAENFLLDLCDPEGYYHG